MNATGMPTPSPTFRANVEAGKAVEIALLGAADVGVLLPSFADVTRVIELRTAVDDVAAIRPKVVKGTALPKSRILP